MKKRIPAFFSFALAAILLVFTGCSNPSGPGNPAPDPIYPPVTNYTLTYDGNGSDGGTVPVDSTKYRSWQTVTVRGNTGGLTKTGKVFDGWNTNANGTGTWYRTGDTFSIGDADKTLFAVWVNTDEKHFWALKTTDSTWYLLTAKKLVEGTHCIVYADVTTGITAANGQVVADKYDNYIHNQITNAFGGIEDVDGNSKVIFLMLDIIDGYTGSGGYVAGYFQPYHMYARSTGRMYSNEADMLFMDTNPGFDSGNQQNFYSTMAHELQHLIEFSETVAHNPTRPEKDLWINEGLSTAAEYIYGTGTGSPAHQQDRIAYFNYDPENTIVFGNNFFVWNGWWEMPANGGDVLANYSTAYLFFQWLRTHASNNTGIYKEIIASAYADYRAVTSAAYNRIVAITSTDWGNLLSTWMIANALKADSGLYGYEGQIAPTIGYFNLPTPVTTYEFAPGEGIYSLFTGSHTSLSTVPSGQPNIKYAGIPSSGTAIVRTTPYTGNLLLTYNANTNNKSYSYEKGVILNYQDSGSTNNGLMSLRSTAPAPSAPLPTSYPIDVHFGPDGTVSPDSPRTGTGSLGKGISAKPLGIGK
ncbi:hypothetical protein AGMMS50268_31430 [Spirochaetia bacterium]|nr:hypothetical protein AGMMS50268_31430 [Spirochaetia bacterium]